MQPAPGRDVAESTPPGVAAPPAPGHLAAGLFRLARPRQWLKNVLVFAAPGAAGVLTEAEPLARSTAAFAAFCLAASGTYFLNDVLDAHADRLHPVKRSRPVASGAVPVKTAWVGAVVLLAAALGLAFAVRWELGAVVASYLALTIAYSAWLKNEAVVDLAAVAAGFVLRPIAGGVAVPVMISPWFLIVAASGSLLMVSGKRHAELIELGEHAAIHRRSLQEYSAAFLSYVRATASSVAILAYSLWAFEKSEPVGDPIWFELSIVPFVLGILRYAFLNDQGKGGAPEELVLSDRVLQVIGLVWVVLFGIALRGS